MKKLILLSALIFATGAGCSAQTPTSAPAQTNLALGKKVLFSPKPYYSALTSQDDETDLTDGKTVGNARLWYEKGGVAWSYPGRFNLAMDLGQQSNINEIAIRFQNGGTPGTGIMFPGWVEAFVSNDGKHYTKVAEFSRWNKNENDFHKFGIKVAPARNTVWTDTLRFQNLKAQGRYVGLRVYGNGVTVSDEITVLGSPAGITQQKQTTGTPSGFTVTQPQIYFNKPYLQVATNVSLPVPIGLTTPDADGADVILTLELPPGLEMVGGKFGEPDSKHGGIKVSALTPKVLSDGWCQYTISQKARTEKSYARMYLRATGWKDGQSGELRYQFGNADWQSPQLSIPVHAVNVPAAPRLKTIMASLGWWNSTTNGLQWRDQLNALRTIGINTFNVFGMWMPKEVDAPDWKLLEKARNEGFFISNIDSSLRQILRHHSDEKEIYDQFADGTVSKKLCISYRGQYYQEEIQRFATMMARVKPDFASEDIELWSGGPKDSRQCTRCQADFKASGLAKWEDWQEAKGKEMLTDLMTAARKAVKDAGGPKFQNGMYDLRPGETYQHIWNFNSLYPQLLQVGEVSTYTSLQPDDIAFIGDQVRKDRAQLPHSDVVPWISPGDSGTFPGDDFKLALLECYANGARGIWFWSSRTWDAENLIAYNKVIRAIAPVEEVIVKGDLVGDDAVIEGEGRISGMKLKNRMMLLAADYFGKSDGTLKVTLDVPAKSSLRDLMTGETVVKVLLPGKQTVTVPLNNQSARLLEVVPR